jgi:hypothetical protein
MRRPLQSGTGSPKGPYSISPGLFRVGHFLSRFSGRNRASGTSVTIDALAMGKTRQSKPPGNSFSPVCIPTPGPEQAC